MFNWIGDYAAWSWDHGFGAILLFVIAMVALVVIVLAVIAGVVQLAALFAQGFRKGVAKAVDEQKP